jgi:hypothetical protein
MRERICVNISASVEDDAVNLLSEKVRLWRVRGWCNVAGGMRLVSDCGAFDVTAGRKPNLSASNTRPFNVNLEGGCGGESALLLSYELDQSTL